MLRAAYQRFNCFAKKYPYATSSALIGARYFIGDAIVQYPNKNLDRRRSTTFILFGVIIGYSWGRLLNQFYPFMMKTLTLKNRLWMIGLEGAINIPFIYYPMFYLTQDFILHNSLSVSRVWLRYKKNIRTDYISWSQFWPAPMFVSITFLPNHLIPVFGAVVGVFWVIILSRMRGNGQVFTDQRRV